MVAERTRRIGDFRKSIVEFGFDRTSGKICKAVVTSVPNVGTSDALPDFDFDSIQGGLPCAALDTWAEAPMHRIDEQGEVVATLTEDRFTVLFGSQRPSESKSVRCGRVAFLLDGDSQFCGMVVFDLSSLEEENLLSATGSGE